MDIITKQREVFFNNLLILRFDKASMEKKYRVTFDRNMFCVANQKTFEVVTHFLFSKLSQVTNQKYSLPWPVLNKDQHRQFQKSCFNYLSAIAVESNVKFPRFVLSLLSTFSGDRFYELYLAFSSHVVQRTIIKKDNVSLIMMPTMTHQNSQDAVDVLRIATILSLEKFQDVQLFSLNHFKMLLKCAKKFVAHIQNLKLNTTTNCSLLQKNINTLKTLYCDDETETNSISAILKKSMKFEEKVKGLWLPFEKFLVKESELWNCVCSEVEGNQDKFCLDGSNFHLATFDNLKKCCPDLNEVGSVVDKENEKLSLIKYLKSFCILLEFYLKTTIKQELLQVNELCFIKKISSLEESLNNIKSLNESIVTNILPSIKDSTKNLEENLLLKEFSEDLEVFLKQCPTMNCCSTNFQELINSSRTQNFSMSLSGDACNFSLIFGDVYTRCLEDVSIESGFRSFSRTTAEKSNFHLINPTTESHQSNPLADIEMFNDKNQNSIQETYSELNFSSDLNFAGLKSHSETQNLIPDLAIKQIVQDAQLFIPSSCIDNFEIDIEYKKPYKLRESWQLEDSLNAMTLPDIPELE